MRRELEQRPLVVLAAALACGLAAPTVWLLWLGFIALCLIKPQTTALVSSALAFGVGWILSPQVAIGPIKQSSYFHQVCEVEELPRLRADTQSVLIRFRDKRLNATVPRSSDLSVGDRWEVEGLIQPLKEGNDDWAAEHRVVGRIRLEADDLKLVSRGPAIYRLARDWRNAFVTLTEREMNPTNAAMVNAVSFDMDSGLSDEDKDALRQTGTIHIVSASGLQVVLFAAMFQGILGLLPIPRWITILLTSSAIAVYALATGLHPAIIRSGLMWMISSSAFLFKRESDSLSALALSAIIVLIWRPISILEIGFYLTFGIVGAFALYGRFSEASTLMGAGRSAVKTSAVAWIASTPLIAYRFGMINWLAVPANLLIAPVIGPIIGLGMLAWLVSGFAPGFSHLLLHDLVEPLAGWIWRVLDFAGRLGFVSTTVPPFSAFWIVLFYLGFALIWRKHVRPAQ